MGCTIPHDAFLFLPPPTTTTCHHIPPDAMEVLPHKPSVTILRLPGAIQTYPLLWTPVAMDIDDHYLEHSTIYSILNINTTRDSSIRWIQDVGLQLILLNYRYRCHDSMGYLILHWGDSTFHVR